MFLSDGIWAADGGDLVTAARFNSLPHPPGFALYTLLLRFAFFLPIGNSAWQASFLSFIFWLAGFICISIASYIFLKHAGIEKKISIVVALSSSLIVFSSHALFLYGTVQEVFSMTVFFISVLILLLVRLFFYSKKSDNLLFWFLFIMALFHHYVVVFMIVPYGWYAYTHKKLTFTFFRNNLLWLLFFVVLNGLPYLYFFYYGTFGHIYWEEKTVGGFFRMILRLRYGFFNSGAPSQPLVSRFVHMGMYVLRLIETTYVLVLFAIPGVFFLLRKHKNLAISLVSGFLISSFFLLLYVNATATSIHAWGIIERYYIFSYPFLAFFIALGIAYLINNAYLRRYSIPLCIFIAGVAVLIFVRNARYFSYYYSKNYIEKYARTVLSEPSKNAVVFLTGDLDLFTAQYVHFVQKYRSDIHLVSLMSTSKKGYLQFLTSDTSVNSIDDLVRWYRKQGNEIYFSFLPSRPYALERRGFLYKLIREDTKRSITSVSRTLQDYISMWSDALPENTNSPLFVQSVRILYMNELLRSAQAFIDRKKFKEANELFAFIYTSDTRDEEMVSAYGYSLSKTNQCSRAVEVIRSYYNKTKNPKAAYGLARLYDECLKDKKNALIWDTTYKKSLEKKSRTL